MARSVLLQTPSSECYQAYDPFRPWEVSGCATVADSARHQLISLYFQVDFVFQDSAFELIL